MNRYNNYHKHDHVSTIITPDSNTKFKEYVLRAIELGEKNCFTTNHGTGGDIFEAKSLCDEYKLNCKMGIEGYIVPNPLEKDNSNYHIIFIPRTNVARKKLNKASSRANKEGYYYKPRFFIDDLLNNFSDDELYITTACSGGILRDENSIKNIFYPLYEKYDKSIFLEVQTHMPDIQKHINDKAIKYSKELGLYLIGANDSHYIYPNQSKERLNLLKGKGFKYGDEDSFILDYPDYNTMVERFQKQGILNNKQIFEAMETTLIFDECENIDINKVIKMPSIYKNLNDDEKIKELKNIISTKFKDVIKKDNIPKNQVPLYKKEILDEMKIIEETKQIHTADYFLLNNKLFEKAINEYGGVLTRTGRGSCGSYIINKILGLTQIDKLSINLPMYSERFISTARLLENNSMPDFDANVAEQEPFVKATRDLLGYNGCYPMVAYGTMQESEAFRNLCRSRDLDYGEYNNVAKNLDSYRNDEKWKPIIDEAQIYINTIISASIHPCAYVLFDGDIEEEIGVVKIGDSLCAMITSDEAEEWKYLKNDYLIVTVWDIISKTFKLINKPILSIKELLNKIDDNVWELFTLGMTCTLNQVDGEWATKLLMEYKPNTMDDLAKFIACIRPSFASYRDDFIKRISHTTGSKELDKVLESTDGRILFQENLMQYFKWLNITPAKSIGLIKKISKKKIKPKDFSDLEDRLKEAWIKNTGSIDMFQETWDDIQSCMEYGFNTPHGVAYAIDCLYGAYLKTNYPLEYYTVVLNTYSDSIAKTDRLTRELDYFNIKIKAPKFRYSRDDYFYDKQNNLIYKGISSIKSIGKKVALGLYELKDMKFDNFVDFLRVNPLDNSQTNILIILDFFSEFGESGKLIKIHKLYQLIEGKKIFSKDKLPISEDIIKKHSKKETDKQYRELNIEGIYNDIIPTFEDKPASLKKILKIQNEYLGYIDYINEKLNDYIFVLDIDTKYSPKIKAYDLSNGEILNYKISKKIYTQNTVSKNDILFVNDLSKKLKRRLDKETNEFIVVDDEYDFWLDKYIVK